MAHILREKPMFCEVPKNRGMQNKECCTAFATSGISIHQVIEILLTASGVKHIHYELFCNLFKSLSF